MRRITVVPLFIFFFIIPISSQTIIDNPEKPLSENAGRIVRLEEVLQIEDSGDAFYFQAPYNLKIGPGGSIFVQDTGQLLQFDREGRFIRNFYKKGQGPVKSPPSGTIPLKEMTSSSTALHPIKSFGSIQSVNSKKSSESRGSSPDYSSLSTAWECTFFTSSNFRGIVGSLKSRISLTTCTCFRVIRENYQS